MGDAGFFIRSRSGSVLFKQLILPLASIRTGMPASILEPG